jgi:hypothetical protein
MQYKLSKVEASCSRQGNTILGRHLVSTRALAQASAVDSVERRHEQPQPTITTMTLDDFWELKRTRTVGPQFRDTA